jgi:hypothetical protein
MSKRSKEAIALRRQALVSAALTPRYPSVFISYSRKDKVIAKALADDLAAAGVPVWWDREIYPGDDFHNAIVTALDQAQAVIVIWSADSAASPWVRDEARRAAHKKAHHSARAGFDPAQVPLGFGDNHSESIRTASGCWRRWLPATWPRPDRC